LLEKVCSTVTEAFNNKPASDT